MSQVRVSAATIPGEAKLSTTAQVAAKAAPGVEFQVSLRENGLAAASPVSRVVPQLHAAASPGAGRTPEIVAARPGTLPGMTAEETANAASELKPAGSANPAMQAPVTPKPQALVEEPAVVSMLQDATPAKLIAGGEPVAGTQADRGFQPVKDAVKDTAARSKEKGKDALASPVEQMVALPQSGAALSTDAPTTALPVAALPLGAVTAAAGQIGVAAEGVARPVVGRASQAAQASPNRSASAGQIPITLGSDGLDAPPAAGDVSSLPVSQDPSAVSFAIPVFKDVSESVAQAAGGAALSPGLAGVATPARTKEMSGKVAGNASVKKPAGKDAAAALPGTSPQPPSEAKDAVSTKAVAPVENNQRPAVVSSQQLVVGSVTPVVHGVPAHGVNSLPAAETGHAAAAATSQEPATSFAADALPGPTVPGDQARTLAATPQALEVGIASGTHGWLRLRAEMTSSGEVTAAVVASSVGAAQALHRELPALQEYLSREQVGLASVAVSSSASDTSSGMAAGAGGAGRESEQAARQAAQQAKTPGATVAELEPWNGVQSASFPGLLTPASMYSVDAGGGWVNVRV